MSTENVSSANSADKKQNTDNAAITESASNTPKPIQPNVSAGTNETSAPEANIGNEEPMKSSTCIFLASWLSALAIISVLFLINNWPLEPTINVLKSKADSLSIRMDSVKKLTDSAVYILAKTDYTKDSAVALLKKAPVNKPVSVPGRSDLLDIRFFLLAFFSGILGSVLHGLASLSDFKGQGRLFKNWTLWYTLLPISGGVLSLIFFFIIRAGLLPNAGGSDFSSAFGIAAVGALVGMFNDKATTKISEILGIIFSTNSIQRGGILNPGEATKTDNKNKQP